MPATHAAAQSTRTLVFAQSGDAVKLDPALIEDGLSARVTQQIFEGLVGFDGATTRIKPALAETWETSADGKVWTFHLRQGVTFHDGTPFDASAVKANFDRWQSQTGDPSRKSAEFAGVLKLGRTHMMDATPLTFGQELSGHAAQLEQAEKTLRNAQDGLMDLALGGSAVLLSWAGLLSFAPPAKRVERGCGCRLRHRARTRSGDGGSACLRSE